jgi:hypothetical protein
MVIISIFLGSNITSFHKICQILIFETLGTIISLGYSGPFKVLISTLVFYPIIALYVHHAPGITLKDFFDSITLSVMYLHFYAVLCYFVFVQYVSTSIYCRYMFIAIQNVLIYIMYSRNMQYLSPSRSQDSIHSVKDEEMEQCCYEQRAFMRKRMDKYRKRSVVEEPETMTKYTFKE